MKCRVWNEITHLMPVEYELLCFLKCIFVIRIKRFKNMFPFDLKFSFLFIYYKKNMYTRTFMKALFQYKIRKHININIFVSLIQGSSRGSRVKFGLHWMLGALLPACPKNHFCGISQSRSRNTQKKTVQNLDLPFWTILLQTESSLNC